VYLDYAGLRVTNLRTSVRFFAKAFGLREVSRGKMTHGGIWVLLQDPVSQQRLELNWYPAGSRYATPFVPGEGLDHLGFRVNDMAKAGRRVKAAGGRLVDQIRYRGQVAVAFYEGPDGIWLELIRSTSE
jgi:catechol 2,3-dioxygenase-like lactoylglutathione lyase family enzyme